VPGAAYAEMIQAASDFVLSVTSSVTPLLACSSLMIAFVEVGVGLKLQLVPEQIT
tara:strand:+ start:5243 stop:5407 length:165 start_codon:yes stop_codon:yes gene_type:complete